MHPPSYLRRQGHAEHFVGQTQAETQHRFTTHLTCLLEDTIPIEVLVRLNLSRDVAQVGQRKSTRVARGIDARKQERFFGGEGQNLHICKRHGPTSLPPIGRRHERHQFCARDAPVQVDHEPVALAVEVKGGIFVARCFAVAIGQ